MYNGWTNYYTWDAYNWMTSEEPTYIYWTDRARQATAEAEGDKDKPAGILSDVTRDELTDQAPELGASMYSDFLGYALQQINCYELAKAFMEE